MGKLHEFWGRLPARWRAAAIRFAKVLASAGVAAGANAVKVGLASGKSLDPTAVVVAIGAAVVAAAEKYLRFT